MEQFKTELSKQYKVETTDAKTVIKIQNIPFGINQIQLDSMRIKGVYERYFLEVCKLINEEMKKFWND